MTSEQFVNVTAVTADAEWAWPTVTSSPVVMAAGGWLVLQTVQTTLTVLALSDNCLSLLVMYGLVRRLTSPLRLLTSLSFSDMLAAWAMMTVYLSVGNTSSAHHVTCGDVLHTSLLLSAHNAAAMSLTSLSTSHHIATFRPLHYDSLLSARRVWVTVAAVWMLSVTLSHVQFLMAVEWAGSGSYCEAVARHSYIALIISTLIAGVSLLAAVVIYSSILVYLRPVDAFVQPPAGLSDGSHRSTRGVVTGVLLFTCYALAWLPYLVTRQLHTSSHLAVSLSGTTLLVGCVINPVIYGCRMTSLYDGYSRLWFRVVDRIRTFWSRCARRHSSDDVSRLPTTPLNQLSSVCY